MLQGASPEKLAQSVAFGLVLGILPLLGVTTSLCLLAAAVLKLNHVAIQTINYVSYPLQIALLIPFFRMGEWIFSKDPISLSVSMIFQEFDHNFIIALQKYLMTGLMGAFAWLLIAPLIWFISYIIFKNLFLKFKFKNH